jgi:hypothetical protein
VREPRHGDFGDGIFVGVLICLGLALAYYWFGDLVILLVFGVPAVVGAIAFYGGVFGLWEFLDRWRWQRRDAAARPMADRAASPQADTKLQVEPLPVVAIKTTGKIPELPPAVRWVSEALARRRERR